MTVGSAFNYHLLKNSTKFSPILIGLNRSRDAIVFVHGETLSAHSASGLIENKQLKLY